MSAARPWWSEITPLQWRTLAAALVGWMLDAMDVMLYAFALTAIRATFDLGAAAAGALASVTLLASAFGGIAFGVLADRFGRVRMLVVCVLFYSLFTGATATAGSVAELVVWRTLVGIGLGGEWTAGSVLVAETWPARHRGKAIGLMQSGWAIGVILAAVLSAFVLPRWGWRPLFVVGLVPALFAAWVRRNVPEPAIWLEQRRVTRVASTATAVPLGAGAMFRPPLLRRTVAATAMGVCLLFAYWGLFTWVPAYLASPVAEGGAGLGVVRSLGWVVSLQVGAFLGYTLFGLLSDRFGRRRVFLFFVLSAAAVVPLYGLAAHHPGLLLILGPLVGFFGHGYFSVFGAILAELFPSAIRATAQGFCYNAGRAVAAAAPLVIGALADRFGIGSALCATALFYVLGAATMGFLPETRGEELT